MNRIALLVAAAASLIGAQEAHAQIAQVVCVPTTPYGGGGGGGGFGSFSLPSTSVCPTASNAVEVTQLQNLQAQTDLMRQLVAQVTALTQANAAFRQSFQEVVVRQQTQLRDQVVGQLSAIPGQVAADPQVVDAIARAVANRLAQDEAFQRSLREGLEP